MGYKSKDVHSTCTLLKDLSMGPFQLCNLTCNRLPLGTNECPKIKLHGYMLDFSALTEVTVTGTNTMYFKKHGTFYQ